MQFIITERHMDHEGAIIHLREMGGGEARLVLRLPNGYTVPDAKQRYVLAKEAADAPVGIVNAPPPPADSEPQG